MPKNFLEMMGNKKQKAFLNRLNHLCESGKILPEKGSIFLDAQIPGDVETAHLASYSPEVIIPIGNVSGYDIVLSLKVTLKK